MAVDSPADFTRMAIRGWDPIVRTRQPGRSVVVLARESKWGTVGAWRWHIVEGEVDAAEAHPSAPGGCRAQRPATTRSEASMISRDRSILAREMVSGGA